MANKRMKTAAAVAFWIIVWQLGAMLANRSLLIPIPTPLTTAQALRRLLGSGAFYATVGLSVLRIVIGFLAALLLGTICALAAAKWERFHNLTAPVLQLIRAVPVASFTILVFLWVTRGRIPSFISFLTVFPIVWANVESGIRSVDTKLIEMANIFGMSRRNILREITLPAVNPYLSSAITTGLGFAWKSGVAAEVICRTDRSLGNLLWVGKTGIDYDEVFAVTLVIVALSVLLQAVVRSALKGGQHDSL